MSENPTLKGNREETMAEQQVAEYLRSHPHFFEQHEELLQTIRVPHQSGVAISLVERQTALLRQCNQALNGQLHGLLEAARHNDLQFEKTKRLVLSLLEANDLNEVVTAVDEGLCQDFNGDLTRLILFAEPADFSGLNLKVLPLAEAKSQAAELIDSDWAVCGNLTPAQRDFLFEERASKVLSAAVIPLIKGRTIGVLAIGSYESGYFHSSMGTLFLSYFGEVLSRVLHRLVELSGSESKPRDG